MKPREVSTSKQRAKPSLFKCAAANRMALPEDDDDELEEADTP
jgi:hypothetical protein